MPLLFFGLVLGPLTAAIVDKAEGGSFWGTFVWLWQHRRFINGPLWFAQALLIFSLVYCAVRALFGPPLAGAARLPRPVPGPLAWWLSALGVGAAALAIRQFVPTGVNSWGLQLGFFSSYIVLFAVGLAAWRNDWLRHLDPRRARAWLCIAAVAWIGMPAAILIARKLNGVGGSNFSGGLSWTAIFYAFWEPLVAWGLIAALLVLFREHVNAPSARWEWLGRRAYAVYIIHPPALVGVALALHGWPAPSLVKFALTGSLAIAACWLLADPLVRLPGVKRVV